MTEEEKLQREIYREKKEKELTAIIDNERDVFKAVKTAYNLAVKDCLKSATVVCIADHISSGHAIRNFAVSKDSIMQNVIPE